MPQESATHLLKILSNEILKSSVGPELSSIPSCLNHLLTDGGGREIGGSSNKVTQPETGSQSDTQAGTLGKRLGAVSKDARPTD